MQRNGFAQEKFYSRYNFTVIKGFDGSECTICNCRNSQSIFIDFYQKMTKL